MAEVVDIRQEPLIGVGGIFQSIGFGGLAAEQSAPQFESGHDGDGFGGTDAFVLHPVVKAEVG